MDNSLVQIDLVENEARVSTLVIAENTNIKYESVRDLVKKYKDDLLQFGNIPSADFKSAVGKESKKLALLNEQQSTLLITFLRNTKEVIAFKKNLVKAFFMMKEKLQSQYVSPISSEMVLAEIVKSNQEMIKTNQAVVENLTEMNKGLHQMLVGLVNMQQDVKGIKKKIDYDLVGGINIWGTQIKRIRENQEVLHPKNIDLIRQCIDDRAKILSDGSKSHIQSITRAIYSYINNEFDVSSYYHIKDKDLTQVLSTIENINIGVQND